MPLVCTIKQQKNSSFRLSANGIVLSKNFVNRSPQGLKPMQRKSAIFTIPPLAALFFVVGWSSYKWLLHLVTEGVTQRIIFFSVQEAFNHRLMTSLSFALVGAIIGISTLLSSRFSALHRYRGRLLILLFVAVLAVSVWIVFLMRRVSALSEHLTATTGLPETSLRLSQIHLYEIGIFGSVCVVVMAIILINRKN